MSETLKKEFTSLAVGPSGSFDEIRGRLNTQTAKLTEGLGAAPLSVGVGGLGASIEGIKEMLALGSPKLALARALGVPLAPFTMRVVGQFSTVSQSQSVSNGSDIKTIQDLIIDDITYQVDTQVTPTGDFDNFNYAMFALQSNFEATLRVVGSPRYEVYPNYTPLAQIKRPAGGWIITNSQGLSMDFQANVALQNAPVKITFVFQCRTTHWNKLVDMTGGEALRALQKLGVDTGVYTEIYC
jgi:hypothetical protein